MNILQAVTLIGIFSTAAAFAGITNNGKTVILSATGLNTVQSLEIAAPEKVKKLDLSYNNLESFTQADLALFPNLKHLNLSNNNFTDLHLQSDKLKKLKVKNNSKPLLVNCKFSRLKKLKAKGSNLTLVELGVNNIKKCKIK